MIGFIFPPQWIPNHPYLAPYLLAARAKSKGVSCRVYDLNLQFYRDHLTQKELEVFDLPASFLNLRLLSATQKKIRDSLKFTEDFASIDLQNANFKHKAYISSDLWNAVKDESNVFRKFYLNLLKSGSLTSHKVIGISVVSYSQLIPSMTLADLIKEIIPNTQIMLGGDMISRISESLAQEGKIWNYADAIVKGDGEYAVDKISDILMRGSKVQFHNIPNVLSKRSQQSQQRLFDLSKYTIPDYSDANVKDYLAPFPMLTLEMSRGCYWSKCTYCECTDKPFKQRSPQSVVDEIEFINKKHHIQHFSFADLALPPVKLIEFAKEIVRRKLNIYWKGMVRAENIFLKQDLSTLYEGGCRMLLIGIETANVAVSKKVNKGIDISKLGSILKNISKSNIWTHGYFIISFPGETQNQIMDTLSFIEQNKFNLNSFSISKFVLLRDSKIFKQPRVYNIKIHENPMENLKTAYFEYIDRSDYDPKIISSRIKSILQSHPYEYKKWGNLDINYLFFYVTHLGAAYFIKKDKRRIS
jgi:radical SAM superfamily enzyme YgiQ (UPF0313 family)